MRLPLRPWLAFLVTFALLNGCGGSDRIELGTWRATLDLPGGQAPFGLELAQESGKNVAYLINGPERVRVPDVTLERRSLSMAMPGFGNTLTAKLKRDKLVGEVVLVKRGGKEQHIPFEAEHGVQYRFFEGAPNDNADVSGRWAVTFTDQEGKQTAAVAEFKQSFHEVTGTFLTPTGDHRYLAGEVQNDKLYLSTFDGAHAFLYHAEVSKSGELKGTFWSGLAWQEQWVAHRDDQAALADPDAITSANDATWHFGFTFPDETGKPVSLADQRFRNKVVIVTLGGSWCPNCHDEAAFLTPFYTKYRERGVEIVTLMFENFEDFAPAAQAVSAFRKAMGIEYVTLVAGISDKQEAAKKLPLLNGVFAFPTTIFIARDGHIRRIHTGFSGPATGAHYDELTRGFTETVEKMLAEPARSAS